jgi:drug/metabolite transporter (DMT)-like permease
MSFFAVFLVVLAALFHATWNLMAKRAAHGGASFVFIYSLTNTLLTTPWAIWVLVQNTQAWSWQVIVCIALSSLLNFVYSLCLQRGYQVSDLSVLYPVARGTGPTLASLGALILLREQPKLLAILGLILVVTGIGLISTQGNLSAFRKQGGVAGLKWGLAIGALIAAYSLVDAWGVKSLGIAPVFLVWFPNVVRVLMLAPQVLLNTTKMQATMLGNWWLALGVGLLSPVSYLLVLWVLKMGAPLSIVAPMREMSMMIAAVLGMIILRERVDTWRLLGCAILVAGVVLLGAA